jgi:aerobic C4-dicarboxylate transport protein
VAGLALILGIDRFMSEARALTNLIGNGVATVVVGKWCGEVDEAVLQKHLRHETAREADEPEKVLETASAPDFNSLIQVSENPGQNHIPR